MDYVLVKEDGIYYIYSERILFLPKIFESRQASRYLAAVELLSKYRYAAYKLQLEYPDIEYLGEVIEHSWGQRVIRFYDLDGHIIEVGEDMKKEKNDYG